MASQEKLPPPAELKRLLADGNTAAQIAEQYGVSLQSVYNRSSGAREKREYQVRRRNQFMPWPLMKPIHQRSMISSMLRTLHAMQEEGNIVPDAVKDRAEEWADLIECNDFVISYHPDAPPSRWAKDGGFFFRPRREGDSPGLMQVPGSSEQPPTRRMVRDWVEEWDKRQRR